MVKDLNLIFPKIVTLIEVFQASIACSIKLKVSMDYNWNNTDRRNKKCMEKAAHVPPFCLYCTEYLAAHGTPS
jgi:hypothetical protein